MMVRFMSMALAFSVIPLTLTAGDDTAVQKEFKAMEGSWKAVAGLQGGQEMPKDKLPRTTYFLHADGKVTARTRDGETMATFSIDPVKNPKTLDMLLESGALMGKKQYAIYKLEGDKLTIFATRPGSAAADRPRDFKAKDAELTLLIFERVKSDERK
jgi:uncharacterized protein (TIGR03067 family)